MMACSICCLKCVCYVGDQLTVLHHQLYKRLKIPSNCTLLMSILNYCTSDTFLIKDTPIRISEHVQIRVLNDIPHPLDGIIIKAFMDQTNLVKINTQ